jgi:hypothetical protein
VRLLGGLTLKLVIDLFGLRCFPFGSRHAFFFELGAVYLISSALA